MIPRRVKALFYFAAGPLMRANARIYRAVRAPRRGTVKVHLGPGQKNYIPGWFNVDANIFTGRADVWADLRAPLPFHDVSVDCAYSHHVIEHLPDLDAHIREIYRCLKPGGVVRIGGPNGDAAISKFLEGDVCWFGDWPIKRRSIGGRLENFIFCKGEHVTILTFSFLEEILQDAGFDHIACARCAADTFFPEWFGEVLKYESEDTPATPHTLIVEAQKPNP